MNIWEFHKRDDAIYCYSPIKYAIISTEFIIFLPTLSVSIVLPLDQHPLTMFWRLSLPLTSKYVNIIKPDLVLLLSLHFEFSTTTNTDRHGPTAVTVVIISVTMQMCCSACGCLKLKPKNHLLVYCSNRQMTLFSARNFCLLSVGPLFYLFSNSIMSLFQLSYKKTSEGGEHVQHIITHHSQFCLEKFLLKCFPRRF